MSTNFRTFDLNLLRVFDTVMAERSLTRAASVLATTQPAVSHALRRLRDALGDPLFERQPGGVRPTARAEALWPQVHAVLQTLQSALAPQAFDPAQPRAPFRIAMSDATAALLCPPLLARLAAAGEGLSLRVRPLTTRDPRPLLDSGEIDLAIGYFPDAQQALAAAGSDANLRSSRLYSTQYRCVMRRGHPLAGDPLTLDAYCAARHLLVSFSGRAFGFVDQALQALGRERRIVLTVNQFFTAGRVVADSDLLTVLPGRFVAATGAQDHLVVRDLPLELAPVHVDLLWHLRLDADPAQAWLRSAVRSAVADTAA